MNLTRIIAPVVAGLLVAALGLAWTFYLYAAQYILAVGMLLLLPAGLAAAAKGATMQEDMAEGFDYVIRNKIILLLMLSVTVPMIFAMPYQQLMPLMVERLGGGPQTFGLLLGAVGCGALAGSLTIATMGDYRRKGLLMLSAGGVFDRVWASERPC